MTDPLLSKTVSIHALSPHSYNCTSKDTITGGFLWIYLSKHSLIALFRANMRLQMFYKIDIPENSAKFTGNHLYQTLLTPPQIFFLEFFEYFRNSFFTEHLWTTASDFNSICILFWDAFVSELIKIYLTFRAILKYFKIHEPRPTEPP